MWTLWIAIKVISYKNKINSYISTSFIALHTKIVMYFDDGFSKTILSVT